VEPLERYGKLIGGFGGREEVVRQAQAALVFVSGHATNVTVIGHLLGPRDLILHDAAIQ